MEKSKLGLSIPLTAMLIYICAVMGGTPIIICAGFMLLLEPNKELKVHALRALIFVFVFTMVQVFFGTGYNVLSLLNDGVGGINNLIGKLSTSFRIPRIPSSGLTTISILLGRICDLLLIKMAFDAFKGKPIKSKMVDKYFPAEYMGEVTGTMANVVLDKPQSQRPGRPTPRSAAPQQNASAAPRPQRDPSQRPQPGAGRQASPQGQTPQRPQQRPANPNQAIGNNAGSQGQQARGTRPTPAHQRPEPRVPPEILNQGADEPYEDDFFNS